jgi:hypothetical protein
MTQEPVVNKRRLRKVGGSRYVLVPQSWLQQHGNPEEVIILADKDMKVLPPSEGARIYKKVSEIVAEKEEAKT